MCYTRHSLNIKGKYYKDWVFNCFILKTKHSAKTIEVSGTIFEYCAQYFSDTSGIVSNWEGVWLSRDKYIYLNDFI